MKKIALLLAVVILLPLAGCAKKDVLDEYFFASDIENQEIGVVESIVEYGDNVIKAINYPVLGNEKIDKNIYDTVMEIDAGYTAELSGYKAMDKDERAWVFTDFKSHLLGENLASIILNTRQTSPEGDVHTSITSMVYNLNTGEQVPREELFKKGYLNALETKCREYFKNTEKYAAFTDGEIFEHGIKAVEENYKNIVFKSDCIEVIFPKYMLLSDSFDDVYVSIDYADISKFLTFDPTQKVIVPVNETLLPPEPENPEIDKDKKMVALTFDDGPFAKVTDKILDILKENNSRATFFMVGNRIQTYPETVARMHAEGSEVANHSYDHANLTKLGAQEIKKQLEDTNAEIEKVAGVRPTLHRPTFGAINDNLKENAGMPLILWNVDTEDWRTKNAEKTIEAALKNVKDGDIILMHDLYEATGVACEAIIPRLIEQGFQLVTVSELMEAKGIEMQSGGKYTNAVKSE